jgi:hypothetical protein
MKFRPLHDRVVVKRIEAEEKSAGGIIIPDTAKEKPSQGDERGAAGSLAQHIRGSWNPPRWSTTTISIALTRTSDRSS